MNISPVVSFPVSADLSSSKEYELVKLTSTGIAIATSITDRVIGTLLRGNDAPANGQSAVGMACDILLSVGNGLHFAKVGNDTAIVLGDELEQDTTDGRLVKRVAGDVVAIAAQACPASNDGAIIEVIMLPQAGGPGVGTGVDVTQITNASTGVTASGLSGVITTVALTTAAAAEERFTVTNTRVGIRDVIALSTTYTGDGTPVLSVIDVTAGTFDIVITNVHASAAFNAAMAINYVVLKAAI